MIDFKENEYDDYESGDMSDDYDYNYEDVLDDEEIDYDYEERDIDYCD